MKIIIVDDEYRIRRGLRNLLQDRRNWQVVGDFENADKALDYLNENIADVLITDIKMPGQDGLDLVQKIRENQKAIVVIILSGFSEFEFARRAIDLGVVRYLTKPTNVRELIATLEQIENQLGGQMHLENPKVQQIISYINAHYEKKISIDDIANAVYLSPNYLCRLFKEETGKRIVEYITICRIEKAKLLLKDLKYNISEVSSLVGYRNTKYFNVVFKRVVKMTPNEYRRLKIDNIQN